MTTSSILLRQAKPEDFPTVLALVGALLTELGEEGDETGELAVEHLTILSQKLGDRPCRFPGRDSGR